MQTKRKNIENNKSEGMLIFKFQLTCLFIKRKITNDWKILILKQRKLCYMKKLFSLHSLSSSLLSESIYHNTLSPIFKTLPITIFLN